MESLVKSFKKRFEIEVYPDSCYVQTLFQVHLNTAKRQEKFFKDQSER